MDTDAPQQDLIARAVKGDDQALTRLLLAHHDRLCRFIDARISPAHRPSLSADDIAQDTYVEAFRRIAGFEPRGGDAFFQWLAVMAGNRVIDLVRAGRAAKRGARHPAGADGPALQALLDAVDVDSHTPSRSVARRQAVGAVGIALAGLRDDYRAALELRYLEGLTVAETAARMGRTERAVHMLCHRGLRHLRDAVGDASKFLSHKA